MRQRKKQSEPERRTNRSWKKKKLSSRYGFETEADRTLERDKQAAYSEVKNKLNKAIGGRQQGIEVEKVYRNWIYKAER